MELRHFYSFVAVAEELNFTKAAKRLHMAQPPVSRHIRDLETELGVRLFERNSSRVFLTDAGRCFLNEARVVLQHVSQAAEAARQVSNGWAGTVRVGIANGLGNVVSRVMNEYLRRASRVEIDVLAIPSGFQSEAITHRKIDVGFMRPPIDAAQLVSASLFLEPFSVVLRKASALAKRKVLHVSDLADETLLLIDRRISPGVYDRTLALFREQGIEPKTVSTATTPGDEAGSILVDSGKGVYIAVGRNPLHPAFSNRLTTLPLKAPSAVTEVHVVWRKDEPSKTTLDFVQFTRSAFKKKIGFIAEHNRSRSNKSRLHLQPHARRPGSVEPKSKNRHARTPAVTRTSNVKASP
jgi:DNA-binding transcriptional LysR family regulator